MRRHFISHDQFGLTTAGPGFGEFKVDFESKITWKKLTDHLRCSPLFFGHPRYDGVIYQKDGDVFAGTAVFGFARLVFVFTISVQEVSYALALVQRMDIANVRRVDRDLSLFRIRTRPKGMFSFIPVRSLVRGAFLFPVPERKSLEFFVIDAIDADMFVRINEIFANR